MKEGHHQRGPQLKVIPFDLKHVEILRENKGDILVRPEGRGNSTKLNAHLADPKMLWPSGVVEYKFYHSFPRYLNFF